VIAPARSRIAPAHSSLPPGEVSSLLAESFAADELRGKKVLLIIPDSTRTCPVGMLFKTFHALTAGVVHSLDILIALGTHQPMSEEAICERLEISLEERRSLYASVRFYNHEWDNPAMLTRIGVIPEEEIRSLSDGLFAMNVPVEINSRVFNYDHLVICGPVFPHEVVGFSGGNKYLFPGVSGPEILNFFHWLGAVVTNPMIIGNKWTPVRKVVDHAASLVSVPKSCMAMVVDHGHLAGLFCGSPESAWDAASELSRRLHVEYKDAPFHTVLSCAPPMYDELWVGGKCMYKLEPVVADGGELIIYAPHIREISLTHGKVIREVGYHCRDYFLKQWDRFGKYPWGVIAHSSHVRGIGTFENGRENCRVQVTLATGIPEETCKAINLGYRDPASIRPEEYANREHEGVLHVPKAGEMLYHLRQRPAWARET
jgi:nickel-dependent lactate racemase